LTVEPGEILGVMGPNGSGRRPSRDRTPEDSDWKNLEIGSPRRRQAGKLKVSRYEWLVLRRNIRSLLTKRLFCPLTERQVFDKRWRGSILTTTFELTRSP
jgi:hypothetical protein